MNWLPDHQVGGTVVFPGAGYIEIFLAMLEQQSSAESSGILRNVMFHRAMILGEDEDTTIRTTLTDGDKISILADWHQKMKNGYCTVKQKSEAELIHRVLYLLMNGIAPI